MVGWATEWVSVDFDLHLNPIGPVQPVYNGTDETGRVIVGQEVIETPAEAANPGLVALG